MYNYAKGLLRSLQDSKQENLQRLSACWGAREPGPAHPKKLEATEQQLSRMQHYTERKDLVAPWRAAAVSIWKG